MSDKGRPITESEAFLLEAMVENNERMIKAMAAMLAYENIHSPYDSEIDDRGVLVGYRARLIAAGMEALGE
jgi:hypothetical protein